MQNLTVTVFDRNTGRAVEVARGVSADNADHFIQTAYADHKDRGPLAARIELDLDDECLTW